MANPRSAFWFGAACAALSALVQWSAEAVKVPSGLPVFVQQTSCEATGDAGVLRLRAEVSGAGVTLQWLSNNVALARATNAWIEFAPNLEGRTAFVLVASNAVGVVPSRIAWSDECEEMGIGALRLNTDAALVLDSAGAPVARGEVAVYVARSPEQLEGTVGGMVPRFGKLAVTQGRIRNDPVTVWYKPDTRVFAQFRLMDDFGVAENSRSKYFEAVVGTTNSPGSLDAVQPFKYRPWDAYGAYSTILLTNEVRIGRQMRIPAQSMLSPYAPQGAWAVLQWRRNGVDIPGWQGTLWFAIGPTPVDFGGHMTTFADAGNYELTATDGYMATIVTKNVSIGVPGEFRITGNGKGESTLRVKSLRTGRFEIEESTSAVNWTTAFEGEHTNSANVLEFPIVRNGVGKIYRLK